MSIYYFQPIFGIDVNSNETTSEPDFENGSFCRGCSIPLQNIVGALGQDPLLASAFAIEVLSFVVAAVLTWVSYRASRQTRALKTSINVFSLRTALILFTIARLLTIIFIAVPDTVAVTMGYLFFGVVPAAFNVAADTVLVWTMTRTVCQSLVIANGYHRALGVGLGLSISYGLVALLNWAVGVNYLDSSINGEWTVDSAASVSFVAEVTIGSIGLVWGIVIFALAIHGLRKTRTTLDPAFRIVNKLMIAVSVIWSVRIPLIVINGLHVFDELELARSPMENFSSLIGILLTDVLGLAIFALLFLCYRPHLLPLYCSNGAYLPPEDQFQLTNHHAVPDYVNYRKSGISTAYAYAGPESA